MKQIVGIIAGTLLGFVVLGFSAFALVVFFQMHFVSEFLK